MLIECEEFVECVECAECVECVECADCVECAGVNRGLTSLKQKSVSMKIDWKVGHPTLQHSCAISYYIHCIYENFELSKPSTTKTK